MTEKKTRVLLTGADGQLGYELQRNQPKHIELMATNRQTLDITQTDQIQTVLQAFQPDCVINAAAYTAVDKAETEQEQAYRINAQAPGQLAHAIAVHHKQQTTTYLARQSPIALLHISTDFVFSGQENTPYATDAPTGPLSVYGDSKLQGEQAVLQALPSATIIRTSWLYSAHGQNFVKSMLRLMQEKEQLGIVFDQVGSPTWAGTLADTVWKLLDKQAQGLFHCSDQGVASWYDFAMAIQEEAYKLGLLTKKIPITPIRSHQYVTPAKRPAYSVMDKSITEQTLDTSLPYWRQSLHTMLNHLKQSEQT